MLLLKQLLEEKKKMLPGLLLALLLGAGGVWALAAGEGFPHYNRYYTPGEYLKEVEQAMAENLPFSRQLSELAVQLKMAGGAKEFDGIFVGDDILIEDIGQPNQRQTEQNIQTLTQFSQSSRIPTYFMLLPTKCAIKQNELPTGVPLFNQKQFIEQTYNHLLGKATVVDVYPALFAKFEEDLYYKTSPSLTALGGYSVYEVLAQRLDNTPKPQEDFDIQYVTHNYYGPTYRRSTYQEISPDVIALYRYQKNNRTYTVTHNEGYSYSYDSLYPQQMMQLGEPTQVLLGGNTGDITIRSNLRIAKLDATDEELVEACKKASIHDFILSLPQGYDTPVEELGDSLSGGERQRIGLARAFLHDAPLLLLDEPTSNLDSLNEAVILRSLHNQRKDKTVVLVSHRQSTMRIADTVYSVEDGRMS